MDGNPYEAGKCESCENEEVAAQRLTFIETVILLASQLLAIPVVLIGGCLVVFVFGTIVWGIMRTLRAF